MGEDIIVNGSECGIGDPLGGCGGMGEGSVTELKRDVVGHGVGGLALEPEGVDVAGAANLVGGVDHLVVGSRGITIKWGIVTYGVGSPIVDGSKPIDQRLGLKRTR